MANYDKFGLNEKLIKDLQEKSMEKRSQATKIVQNEIEELAGKGDMEAIKIKIVAFTRLTEDFSQAAYRRAGLYGISAVGVALYQRNVSWCASYSFVETNVVLGAAHLPNRKLV